MFEEAKVGDRVWDFVFNWGTVIQIDPDEIHHVKVFFDTGERRDYLIDGRVDEYVPNPTLFWNQIDFDIPPKPKKKVKKVIKMFTNRDSIKRYFSNGFDAQDGFVVCSRNDEYHNVPVTVECEIEE